MGKLIVIEGLDGSGKSTQTPLLERELKEQGRNVMVISFPDYGSESSALVRMYLSGAFGEHPDDVGAYAASSFYAVDRYASYMTGWRDFYQRPDSVVLATRYTSSNEIHQLAKLPRDDWDAFIRWTEDYEFEKLKIPRPDAVLYLDMKYEIASVFASPIALNAVTVKAALGQYESETVIGKPHFESANIRNLAAAPDMSVTAIRQTHFGKLVIVVEGSVYTEIAAIDKNVRPLRVFYPIFFKIFAAPLAPFYGNAKILCFVNGDNPVLCLLHGNGLCVLYRAENSFTFDPIHAVLVVFSRYAPHTAAFHVVIDNELLHCISSIAPN